VPIPFTVPELPDSLPATPVTEPELTKILFTVYPGLDAPTYKQVAEVVESTTIAVIEPSPEARVEVTPVETVKVLISPVERAAKTLLLSAARIVAVVQAGDNTVRVVFDGAKVVRRGIVHWLAEVEPTGEVPG
jgi:hypothetical protein